MREIKFRAYNIENKEMFYNAQDTYDWRECPATSFGELLDSEEWIVTQYTGFKDKNDKEIYEGDILRGNKICLDVTFYKGMFSGKQHGVSYSEPLACWEMQCFEIIGNIYNNPELLKGENNMNKNYITSEQFLQQSEEVQKALIDWWKPQIGDLFQINLFKESLGVITQPNYDKNLMMPLFNETQLRRFIEEYTECKFDITYSSKTNENTYNFQILGWQFRNNDTFLNNDYIFHILSKDLLQAYWQVVCKIINKEIPKEES